MSLELWQHCLDRLEDRVPATAVGTYLMPLHALMEGDALVLLAPNPIVADEVEREYLQVLRTMAREISGDVGLRVQVRVGNGEPEPDHRTAGARTSAKRSVSARLDPNYSFENFVPGKSNSVARAAAEQVADHPGASYNPLLIYGGVGLGKTHLMQAIGNRLHARDTHIVYMSAERFVTDMVGAIRHNRMDEFKRGMRSADTLLIDDIQFFAGKRQSQEEFFHTFNALLEGKQQIVLTCDRFPKELDDLEERLKSRFSWGLTVSVEPPELETRVAILMSKAEKVGFSMPQEVAFFIAKRVKSNVRDLESALHRLIAHSKFTGNSISIDFAKQTLHDMLASHDRHVTIDSIQKCVAEYYKIRINDLLSGRRTRSLARPRQLAMALAKELTHHSLPEIGQAFGGRDHTTVLHAHRKIAELRESDPQIGEDYSNLYRTLSR